MVVIDRRHRGGLKCGDGPDWQAFSWTGTSLRSLPVPPWPAVASCI